jgi:hypothetical protein
MPALIPDSARPWLLARSAVLRRLRRQATWSLDSPVTPYLKRSLEMPSVQPQLGIWCPCGAVAEPDLDFLRLLDLTVCIVYI